MPFSSSTILSSSHETKRRRTPQADPYRSHTPTCCRYVAQDEEMLLPTTPHGIPGTCSITRETSGSGQNCRYDSEDEPPSNRHGTPIVPRSGQLLPKILQGLSQDHGTAQPQATHNGKHDLRTTIGTRTRSVRRCQAHSHITPGTGAPEVGSPLRSRYGRMRCAGRLRAAAKI